MTAYPSPRSKPRCYLGRYADYPRLKLRQAAAALPADAQQSTFSDDR